ncbi:hypothetical protein DPEC_G00358990 [Dallia pectoralis]|uniref:Uncharacterized protein n=1 Tax=Dallia pectoralis TaxID=75939 RepID=A0ACC2F0F7_DALPE|nr:hypothetical protein DPEC_G00358990 [Dallia pectoralis]
MTNEEPSVIHLRTTSQLRGPGPGATLDRRSNDTLVGPFSDETDLNRTSGQLNDLFPTHDCMTENGLIQREIRPDR